MQRPRGDDGAAVVDFVLVSVLLLVLFLLVVQVGLLLHVRTVMAGAAAEGARLGATADRTPEEGAARAQQAVRDSLGSRVSDAVRCRAEPFEVDGAPVVEIVCRGAVPIALLPGPAVTLEGKGHALEESR